MISIRNLSKVFSLSKKQIKEMGPDFKGNTVAAVDNISFDCQNGRIFGLIGPNGAGKTTTLRMIATMLKPSSGTILVNNYDVSKDSINVRKSLGFLSGNTGIYDRLTCEEMVKYYADLHTMNRDKYQESKNKLFDLLDMHDFANRRIAKLSTGMKQKVNIARTMIHEPDVVVFDEPTSGLDVTTSQSIIKMIRDCKDMGKTVIFSSHRFGEIRSLCDDIAIIHSGKLFFNGTYDNFESQMKADTLEDEFIRLIKLGSDE